MKKLEELGISPTPWSFADDGTGACDIRCSGVPYGEDYEGDDIIAQSVQKKDAAMLTAAPKLYAVIWDVCFGQSTTVNCAKCGGDCHGGVEYCSKTCPLYNARAALAEAAGEGHKNGETR